METKLESHILLLVGREWEKHGLRHGQEWIRFFS